MKVYVVHTYNRTKLGIEAFAGCFSTEEKAKIMVDEWNKKYGDEILRADYIVTEMDNNFFLEFYDATRKKAR